MKVSILCVGKIKEKFYTDAISEYAKRMKRFADFEIVEIPDERIPDNASKKEKELIKEREGEKILQKIGPQDHVIAMCIDGRQYESTELAAKMSNLFTQGKSNITFLIGGSLGLHPDVLKRANERMSMSKMTFPHQLARVMLLEQLFRAAKINAGERYHK